MPPSPSPSPKGAVLVIAGLGDQSEPLLYYITVVTSLSGFEGFPLGAVMLLSGGSLSALPLGSIRSISLSQQCSRPPKGHTTTLQNQESRPSQEQPLPKRPLNLAVRWSHLQTVWDTRTKLRPTLGSWRFIF